MIDDAALHALEQELPILSRLAADESDRLKGLMARFLTDYTVTGAQGLEVTDAMRLLIAAQACLPVLALGLQAYDRFSEVIVYPSAFEVRRRLETPEGLVSEFDDILSGEAQPGGPVVLSWVDLKSTSTQNKCTNLVIHEFAHKLD
ncbi:MAG: zinc-dependent peptidase, partial [Burkholderiaceae bacterium]